MTIKKIILSCAVLPMLSACAVGPDYERPQQSLMQTSSFLNAPVTESDGAEKSQSIDRWWENIDDPLLSDYISQLMAQNLDLKQAGERVLQARARLGVQRGSFMPSLGADASASRSFTVTSGERSYTTNYNPELQTSWEIDVFGRIRRSVESAQSSYEASLYDREALMHSVIAELLTRRVAISVNQRLMELAQQNAENREQTLNLVRNRYDLGVSSVTLEDILLAEENYSSVQADSYQYKRSLVDETYALDVLLGQLPGTTNPTATRFPILPPPQNVAVCVPALLLDRRPDLKASELRVRAANADIGIAIADLYPTLSLGGALGFSGDATGGLFSADQLAGSIIASLTASLFQGGALRANIDLQEAEARELAHAYAANVLEAMREVESALQAENELDKEIASLSQSAQSLQKAEELVEDRYRNGIATLRDVLDTQQRRYQTEQGLILRQQQKWNTRIALYLALGGDWFADRDDQMKNEDTYQEACQ